MHTAACNGESQRADKWLWSARFYKTRSAAATAVRGGKVTVNGARAKPATTLRAGDCVAIKKPPFTYEIEVRGLARTRGPATVARLLYEETAQSHERRAALAEQIALAGEISARASGKLSKKERRARERLKRTC